MYERFGYLNSAPQNKGRIDVKATDVNVIITLSYPSSQQRLIMSHDEAQDLLSLLKVEMKRK